MSRGFTDDKAPQRRTAATAEKVSLKVAALPAVRARGLLLRGRSAAPAIRTAMLSFRNVPNFARPRKRGPSEYGDFDRLLRQGGKP